MLKSRYLKLALDAWQTARQDKLYPSVRDMSPAHMVPFIEHVAMLRREADGAYRISLMGTALVELLGADVTGKDASAPHEDASRDDLRQFHDFAFQTGCLCHSLREMHYPSGSRGSLEQLLLPLTHPDGTHDRFMIVADASDEELSVGEKRDSNVFFGKLHHRMLYDAGTLQPLSTELNRPDPAMGGHGPLVESIAPQPDSVVGHQG